MKRKNKFGLKLDVQSAQETFDQEMQQQETKKKDF